MRRRLALLLVVAVALSGCTKVFRPMPMLVGHAAEDSLVVWFEVCADDRPWSATLVDAEIEDRPRITYDGAADAGSEVFVKLDITPDTMASGILSQELGAGSGTPFPKLSAIPSTTWLYVETHQYEVSIELGEILARPSGFYVVRGSESTDPGRTVDAVSAEEGERILAGWCRDS